jgi:hypothetical protein
MFIWGGTFRESIDPNMSEIWLLADARIVDVDLA